MSQQTRFQVQYTHPSGDLSSPSLGTSKGDRATEGPHSNRVGGGLAAPVLPHHRTYSSYPAVSSTVLTQPWFRLVKARSRFNAVDACHSSHAADPVPPSPLAPGRTFAHPGPRALLLLHTHRVSPPAPCRRRFGPSSTYALTTMASADFSAPFRQRLRRRSLALPDRCRDLPG